MRALPAVPKRSVCRLLLVPLAATVTCSWPARVAVVVTCTGGRGLQATGTGCGAGPLLALGAPVGGDSGALLALGAPVGGGAGAGGVEAVGAGAGALELPGGKACGPPPTRVGQSPQRSVTVRGTVAA